MRGNYFTETCSGSEAGSYLRLIDFVYHSTLGLRVIKKKKMLRTASVHQLFPDLSVRFSELTKYLSVQFSELTKYLTK